MFRRLSEEAAKDVPKELHPKLQAVYEKYLREHLPVLKRNLGSAAVHEPVWDDAKHGPGASVCFQLFPGFYPESRSKSFINSTFISVLGASEQKVRKLMSAQFTPDLLKEHGCHEEAVSQQFHHTLKVHQESYKTGLRNTINKLQAKILKWDSADI